MGRAKLLTSFLDEVFLLVVGSSLFEVLLTREVAPVVTAGATLGQSGVHAVLGHGAVLDEGVGVCCALSASHDVAWREVVSDETMLRWVYADDL